MAGPPGQLLIAAAEVYVARNVGRNAAANSDRAVSNGAARGQRTSTRATGQAISPDIIAGARALVAVNKARNRQTEEWVVELASKPLNGA